MQQEEKLSLQETRVEDREVQQTSDSTNQPIVRIIQVTERGARDLYSLLVEELGYIENDEFKRVLDRLEEWINTQCGSLALFYVKARQNGLVPSNEVTDSIDKRVRKVNKGTSIPRDEGVVSRLVNFLKRRPKGS